MTETELEVLDRLAHAGEFYVVIRDWGVVKHFLPGHFDAATWLANPTPLVVFGDKRISFYFRMSLMAPAIPQPNWYFDMEVWAMGTKLFSQRMPTEYGGKPIEVAAGLDFDWALDVAIDKIDPNFIKQIKPGAIGLTSRQDNMHLDTHHQRLLHFTQDGEKKMREEDARRALATTRRKKRASR